MKRYIEIFLILGFTFQIISCQEKEEPVKIEKQPITNISKSVKIKTKYLFLKSLFLCKELKAGLTTWI